MPKRSKTAVASKAKSTKKLKVEVKEEEGDVEEKVEVVQKKSKAKSAKGTVVKNLLPDDWYNSSKSKMFVGAHVSISGGLENAVFEAASIGAQAFGLFLANQRTWNIKPLDSESVIKFKKACKEYGYPSHLIVPHASYLMNVGSADPALRQKSQTLLTDGLKRCDALGIDLYNFHPGSTCGKIPIKECIGFIAKAINASISETSNAIVVIENMCKQGNTIGGEFSEIKAIIDLVENKDRVGVCLDTCHAFAAGHDVSSEAGYEKMMQEFDSIIGLKYLKAIHLNDSKGPVGSHLDRHENIGNGKIGLKAFTRIMNDPRLKNIPMILETPVAADGDDVYRREVQLLYGVLK